MFIRHSSISSLDLIFKIFKDCRENMELEGIFQWTDSYPNVDIIANDIKSQHLFELTKDGKILGAICINTTQEPEYCTINWSEMNGNPIVIHRLAIDPLFQNKGLANELMTFAEDFAIGKGFTSIRLDAFSGNKKALKLYEDRGYIKIGEVYFEDRNQPFYCYERLLNIFTMPTSYHVQVKFIPSSVIVQLKTL